MSDWTCRESLPVGQTQLTFCGSPLHKLFLLFLCLSHSSRASSGGHSFSQKEWLIGTIYLYYYCFLLLFWLWAVPPGYPQMVTPPSRKNIALVERIGGFWDSTDARDLFCPNSQPLDRHERHMEIEWYGGESKWRKLWAEFIWNRGNNITMYLPTTSLLECIRIYGFWIYTDDMVGVLWNGSENVSIYRIWQNNMWMSSY